MILTDSLYYPPGLYCQSQQNLVGICQDKIITMCPQVKARCQCEKDLVISDNCTSISCSNQSTCQNKFHVDVPNADEVQCPSLQIRLCPGNVTFKSQECKSQGMICHNDNSLRCLCEKAFYVINCTHAHDCQSNCTYQCEQDQTLEIDYEQWPTQVVCKDFAREECQPMQTCCHSPCQCQCPEQIIVSDYCKKKSFCNGTQEEWCEHGINLTSADLHCLNMTDRNFCEEDIIIGGCQVSTENILFSNLDAILSFLGRKALRLQ